MMFNHPCAAQVRVRQFDSWQSTTFTTLGDFECPDEPDESVEDTEGGEAQDD